MKKIVELIARSFRFFMRYYFWIFNFWRFKSFGWQSFIDRPLKIDGAKNIIIEDHVIINYKTWLASMPLTDTLNPLLKIGAGSVLGNFNHIYATNRIIIGENVLTADKVYISDNLHGYNDPLIPIMYQPIVQNRKVIIGDGSWIGENVVIIGSSIGKNCVIGANSVVTKDIPDYCVVVGNPARIIKMYNLTTKNWERVL